MYCFLLVVDDVAGNHRMARKFVLFDDVNEVEIIPDADKAMVVKSAAANTSFTWFTELNNPVRNVCPLEYFKNVQNTVERCK